MSKFLVYWTRADIDSIAADIFHDVTKRITKAGFAKHLGVVSDVVGGITSTTHLAYSKVLISAVSATTSLLRGRPMYYQHLLFARKARDKHIAAGTHSP